jgi:hypothetical protein
LFRHRSIDRFPYRIFEIGTGVTAKPVVNA